MQAATRVPGSEPGDRGRPLVVTADGDLLDELVGLAAAGGVEVSVAIDAVAAEDRWASAPLVVVGADQVASLARRDLPRRLNVILVARPAAVTPLEADSSLDGPMKPAGWSGAAALHPEHVVMLPDARPWLVMRFAQCRAPIPRPAAPVVAFVSASPDAGASPLAAGVALTAHRQGLATLLVGVDRYGAGADRLGNPADLRADPPSSAGGDATAAAGDRERPDAAGATLAVLSFDCSDGAAVPPPAMAAALRAAQHGRDLVIVDLSHGYDDASRLALTCADRCYLIVVAEIRECAAAARVAATVRRHCPRLALVVRAVTRRGLRPDEVAEALGLPLAGVLPPQVGAGAPPPGDPGPVAAALYRQLLAQIGATRHPGPILPGRSTPDGSVVDQ